MIFNVCLENIEKPHPTGVVDWSFIIRESRYLRLLGSMVDVGPILVAQKDNGKFLLMNGIYTYLAAREANIRTLPARLYVFSKTNPCAEVSFW